jgi:protein TonB
VPRSLFDQSVITPPRNRKRSRTLVVSIALHAAVLVALVAVQLAAIEGPDIARRIERVMIAAPPPPSPPPRTPTTRQAVAPLNPDAAPLAATEQPVEPATPPAFAPAISGVGAIAGDTRMPRGLDDPVIVPPAPAPPTSTKPLPVGGNIRAPERTAYSVPDYPVVARAAKVDGVVILEATIDEHGIVRGVKVLRSIPLLDQAAIDAVSKWRYTPTQLNGQPIAVIMTVTVRFSLK